LDREVVKNRLCEVLRTIQSKRRLQCPPLLGHSVPADELERFDSKMWPIAIGMLASALGVPIPNDANVFKVGRRTQTIDEAVTIVCALAAKASSA
jgi:hypothetical protein